MAAAVLQLSVAPAMVVAVVVYVTLSVFLVASCS